LYILEKFMNIKITKFALRHFDKNFIGTKILSTTPIEFEKWINKHYNEYNVNIIDGYAPFCKILITENITDAKIGSMNITLENYQYLRSGYLSRTENELPVFTRWFELPIPAPKSNYLMIVLYDRKQLLEEFETNKKDGDIFELEEDVDYGIVAILGKNGNLEEPMKPETMIRNALGIEEGGSGVKLDREKYLKSVEYWSNNATIR